MSMLPLLSIRNYRNLKCLEIDSLARVNLIAGKNNTGKTSLLEAVSLYASGGDLNTLLGIFRKRGELFGKKKEDNFESNLSLFSSLFYDRKSDISEQNCLIIGEKVDCIKERSDSMLSVRFIELKEEGKPSNVVYSIGLEVGFTYYTKTYQKSLSYEIVYPLEKDLESLFPYERYNKSLFKQNCQFIDTTSNSITDNSLLWDIIALTEKEAYVIDALKIIDEKVERIAFVNDELPQRRNAVVKLSNNSQPVPLKSMGDGMNRILTIILALVNAENGFLLIDEFENGLHYTVQEDLWKMIFKLAQSLNVQVFATTHSNDCIYAFERVMNDTVNDQQGKFIRLDRVNDVIKPVSFTASELDITTQQDIEIR